MSDFKIVKLLDPPVSVTISITPRGAWNSATAYAIGDLVSYDGLSYISLTTNVNQVPLNNTTYWQVVADVNLGSNDWLLTGNTGTNPSTDFLGTIDAQPIKFRTNNLPVGQFDGNGRFGIGPHSPRAPLDIKPYSGYRDSGLRIEPFALNSSSTTPSMAYAITMSNNQVVKVKFNVTCRQSDGSNRATFTRSALFYKEGGNVQMQGPTWQSDLTIKSSNGFDVSYALGVNTIIFNVKNASNTLTYWSGHVELEFISTDAV
jgi:hypothetical protein